MSYIRRIVLYILAVFILFMPASIIAGDSSQGGKEIHHDLKIVFYPEEHRFSSEDTITVPEYLLPEFQILLHRGLNPSSPTIGISIYSETAMKQDMPHESFKIKLPPGINTFVLKYGGSIDNPIKRPWKGKDPGFSQVSGIISEDVVYLTGSSFWYPVINRGLVTFNLLVELPPEWDAVSQGNRTLHNKDNNSTHVRWESSEPQEEIFITAARYNEYSQFTGKVLAMVFLRTPDKGLANKYLDASIKYINMFETLIGPYPYKKFALVENIQESGISMPSFTLLGPKMIRFPFVIDYSFPHEILYNWWGKSVFPDYEQGNWAEGLTAYLSDHLLKEKQSEGASYRQALLQKYTGYVSVSKDFPVSEFRSRTSSSSQAIGYGKSLMFFHMLRLQLGDKVFTDGLRKFYRENRFHFASFIDLMKSFESVSGKNLKKEFDQWIAKPGAPRLAIGDVKISREKGDYILSAVLDQKQHGRYLLRVPVTVTMEGHEKAYQSIVLADKKRVGFKLVLPSRPLRIDIDPEYDVFRRLNRDEIPPSISHALGAKKMLILLPSDTNKQLLQAYRQFAKVLAMSGPDEVEVKLDSDIEQFPSDCAVTVFGIENRFVNKVFASLSRYKVTVNHKAMRIGKTEIPLENHSIVFTSRNPENEDMAIMFVTSRLPEALFGISRKLPYYNKYSYVGFAGNEQENTIRGTWPVVNSPLTVHIPDEAGNVAGVEMGELAERKPLATLQTIFSEEEMMQTIRFLSSEELKGRGLGTEELDRAAQYIAQKFQESGIKPAGDSGTSYLQTFEDWISQALGADLALKNVIGVIPGRNPKWHDQSVVVAAHYDHLGLDCVYSGEDEKELYCPGANDNASGVAVLTELARVLNKSLTPERSIVFAAFTNEEKGKSGSLYYVHNEKLFPAGKCIGMLNIDTVGQMKKNRLLILDTGSAREWMNIFKTAGSVAGVDIDFVSEKLDTSDQISFIQEGIPAVQFFSGPHPDYHQPTDTADRINAAGLVKTALLAKEVIGYLANREDPLIFTGDKEDTHESIQPKKRKVSLGIIPDSTFTGHGCKVSGLSKGSQAEGAGLKKGDIIIRLNAVPVNHIRDVTDILGSLVPGDEVAIVLLRNGEEMTVSIAVKEPQ
jgi:aminopeptidase N